MTSADTSTGADATAHEVERELAEVVGDKRVTRRAASLAEIGVTIDSDGACAWLVEPGSAAEIAELLQIANTRRIAVIPLGNRARTPRTATLAHRTRMFLDIRRLKHVLDLDETSLVVHVQAGLTALALEKILSPRGLTLGDYPPAALGSTIGGLLAVRTPGKSSARHGFIEDAVLGVSSVLADGRTIHTRVAPRRATGPDLARAICGSEGTIGVITSAVLRIHRRPEARFLAAHALPDFASALAAMNLALREEAAPAAMRIYDTSEARAHLGDEAVEDGEALLVAATAGPTDLAACDRDLIASAAEAMGGRRLDRSLAQRWWDRRSGHGEEDAPPMPSFQVSATPGKQLAVYDAVRAAAQEHDAAARAHASRFGLDGAVMFFTLVSPLTGAPLDGERLEDVRAEATAAAAAAGAFLLGVYQEHLGPYLAELQRQLDPNGIMNPGASSR